METQAETKAETDVDPGMGGGLGDTVSRRLNDKNTVMGYIVLDTCKGYHRLKP